MTLCKLNLNVIVMLTYLATSCVTVILIFADQQNKRSGKRVSFNDSFINIHLCIYDICEIPDVSRKEMVEY